MTVLAAAPTSTGIVMVADQAAVYAGQFIAPGVTWPATDRTKLVSVVGGAVVGLAGYIGTGNPADGEACDLLAAMPDVVDLAAPPRYVAAAVEGLMDRASAALRASAPAGAVVAVPSFELPVLTVALIAGYDDAGPAVYAVGLPAQGRAQLASIDRTGTAYAPPGAAHDVENAALTAVGLDPHAARGRIGEAIRAIASTSKHLGLVSQTYDYVVVDRGGASAVQTDRYEQAEVPRH